MQAAFPNPRRQRRGLNVTPSPFVPPPPNLASALLIECLSPLPSKPTTPPNNSSSAEWKKRREWWRIDRDRGGDRPLLSEVPAKRRFAVIIKQPKQDNCLFRRKIHNNCGCHSTWFFKKNFMSFLAKHNYHMGNSETVQLESPRITLGEKTLPRHSSVHGRKQ